MSDDGWVQIGLLLRDQHGDPKVLADVLALVVADAKAAGVSGVVEYTHTIGHNVAEAAGILDALVDQKVIDRGTADQELARMRDHQEYVLILTTLA